MIEHPAPD